MKELPPKAIISMIHVRALPGTPGYEDNMKEVIQQAIDELNIYEDAGATAIMIENMHDVPFIQPPLPKENVSGMLRVAKEMRKNTALPIGIQMLEGANIDALYIAIEAKLDFIRAEGYVYAHVGGAGIIEGSAGELLRMRKERKAEHIKIYADVKKKHCAHALTADLSIADVIKQSDFFKADGIIITGGFTGEPAKPDDLMEARINTELPILAGSGITAENYKDYKDKADGFIVGTFFKEGGDWKNPVSPEKVKALMEAAEENN
ncbi:BtpA/SgcQ family protein [Patescibacteria group bacterium]